MGLRLLSKYLGLETMLAVVCKTHEGVRALESFNMGGLIDEELGLHAFAASIKTPIADQFDVISLEDIRLTHFKSFFSSSSSYNLYL